MFKANDVRSWIANGPNQNCPEAIGGWRLFRSAYLLDFKCDCYKLFGEVRVAQNGKSTELQSMDCRFKWHYPQGCRFEIGL